MLVPGCISLSALLLFMFQDIFGRNLPAPSPRSGVSALYSLNILFSCAKPQVPSATLPSCTPVMFYFIAIATSYRPFYLPYAEMWHQVSVPSTLRRYRPGPQAFVFCIFYTFFCAAVSTPKQIYPPQNVSIELPGITCGPLTRRRHLLV